MPAVDIVPGGGGDTTAIKAVTAKGAHVLLEPQDFTLLVHRMEAPLVVTARVGIIKTSYRYLTSYKGMFFYTISGAGLQFSPQVELVTAGRIRMPF